MEFLKAIAVKQLEKIIALEEKNEKLRNENEKLKSKLEQKEEE